MLAVVTLVLGVTGRLTLYISPETVWFACAAAVVTLIGAIWSCTLPLGAEADHGHDHGAPATALPDHAHGHDDHGHDRQPGPGRRALGITATVAGGTIATAVAAGALLLPPASLSVDMAISRAPLGGALFAGADDVVLGGRTDTSTFGVGAWASVFATGSRPEKYVGTTVTLTGFLTPAGSSTGEAHLTRMVITHCVIDAQPASVPVEIAGWQGRYAVGEWVEVKGAITAGDDGRLRVVPASVTVIDEPKDPYEH